MAALKKVGNVGQRMRERPAFDGQEDILGTLIGMLGQDAALKMVETFGGRRLSIPRYASGRVGRHLAEVIGAEGARAIVARFGGGPVKMPQAKPWRAMLLREAGWHYGEIAQALGTSETAVWRWLKERGMTQAKAARVGDAEQSHGVSP